MKLLKIGRSATCDIVLSSENVSSLHAEILILDNGEIFLEDKNSTNGTKVGNKKIVPNTETPIRRGDYVVFADMELPWARVPQAENLNNYKQVLNIGTNFKNDIVIEGTYCSRYHASFRVSKNGKKAFIRDLNSKNGVKVNGLKIHPNKDVEIKKNDVVICGDTDISEELKPFIPNPYGWMKKATVACSGMIAALVVIAVMIISISNPVPEPPSLPTVRTGVAYVRACYHYVIKFENCPIHKSIWDGTLALTALRKAYQATAFYIDSAGRMATNRHVAVPWEYQKEDDKETIRLIVENLKDNLPPANVELLRTDKLGIGPHILTHARLYGSYTPAGVNSIIKELRKCSYTISGELDYITVGYPGLNYTHEDEFDRCFVLEASDTDDKDIAILQMNNKKTPSEVQFIFDVNNFRTETLKPMQETLYTIGYPNGLGWGMDGKTQSLEPFIRSVSCSKIPSTFDFEFQGESVGGASGSPIFDEYGRLAGVLWGGWRDGVTYGKACQAKWLKQLYKKAIGEIE